MAAAPPLLREWEFLQERVVPPLLRLDSGRPPRTWSIGSVDDAVAVGVAYEHAHAQPSAALDPSAPLDTLDTIELYAEPGPGCDEIGFLFADIRSVPRESRHDFFVRHEGRWIADDHIAEHVFVGPPSDLVDLVTLRSPSGDRAIDMAVDQLAEDGQLLLLGTDYETGPLESATLEFVELSPAGAIYRRGPRTRCRRTTDRPAHQGAVTAREGVTLVRHRTERQLIEDHLRLARSLARRFAHNGEALEDLEQVAMLALVKAARGFDHSRDTRFATYATASILGELKRHFRDKAWMMRVPRPVQELYLSVKRANEELMQMEGAAPTVAEVAEYLETTVDAVREAMRAGENYWPTSLDNQPQGTPPIEIPVIDGALEQSLERLQVRSQIAHLDDREQLVLKRIYFDNRNQREVAEDLGISQMQVSRTLARAVAKLR